LEGNLQREDIGDIALYIAQLYYFYYLHTSDVKYLHESACFYEAISKRSYFDKKDHDSKYIIKNLRYLTRYYQVALLLRDYVLIEDILLLIKTSLGKFDQTSEEMTLKYNWSLVYKEAKTFTEVEKVLKISENMRSNKLEIRNEMSSENMSLQTKGTSGLQAAIIIGTCKKQLKFSELTIDMYRIVQLLQHHSSLKDNKNDCASVKSPYKYLLYKPSVETIFMVLSAISKDLLHSAILLVYISGDLHQDNNEKKNRDCYGNGIRTFDGGSQAETSKRKIKLAASSQCLYTDDLVPFTRKPLFIIIDSEASTSFTCLRSIFNKPLVCLMSPLKTTDYIDRNKDGGLFTLFLLDPILAICRLCKVERISSEIWKLTKTNISKISDSIIEELLQETRTTTLVFEEFTKDMFLRRTISHFIICWMTLRLNKLSQGSDFLPTSTPQIPFTVLENKTLQRHLLETVNEMCLRQQFYDLSDMKPYT